MSVTRLLSALAVSPVLVFAACSETLEAPPRAAPPPNFATTAAAGCGASFTMITDEQDSLMATYGIPATHDTINVCETWTGTDYVMSAQVVGSSEFDVVVRDTVEQVSYANGTISGFDASGAIVDGTTGVGGSGANAGTAFGFMTADSATRKASFDAPYYAISSASPSLSISANSVSLSVSASTDTTTKYHKKGLSRHGVRALVDAMEEIAPSPEGNRRFRTTRADAEEIVSVDPVSELIVGEETHYRDGNIVIAKHRWAPTADGWVRTQTDVDSEERAHDQVFPSHSTIKYVSVRIGAVLQAPRGPQAPRGRRLP